MNKDILIHGISGSIAAVIATFLLYPIDNVKIRMQMGYSQLPQKDPTLKSERHQINNNNSLTIVKKIFHKEGLKGFYVGVYPVLIGNFLSNFLFFLCYRYFKEAQFIRDLPQFLGYCLTSFLSGIITIIFTQPFWVAQTKLTEQQEEFNSQGIVRLMCRIGLRDSFRGFLSSVILISNPIIAYLIYEYLKQMFGSSSVAMFFAGGFSKLVSTVLTYPYQVLRTRCIQNPQHTISEHFFQLFRNYGIAGLFSGLKPKIVQSFLNQAFLLLFYESITDHLIHLEVRIDSHEVIFRVLTFLTLLFIAQKHLFRDSSLNYLIFGFTGLSFVVIQYDQKELAHSELLQITVTLLTLSILKSLVAKTVRLHINDAVLRLAINLLGLLVIHFCWRKSFISLRSLKYLEIVSLGFAYLLQIYVALKNRIQLKKLLSSCSYHIFGLFFILTLHLQ